MHIDLGGESTGRVGMRGVENRQGEYGGDMVIAAKKYILIHTVALGYGWLCDIIPVDVT